MDRKQEWGVSLITAGVGVFSVFTFVFFLARYPAQMLAGVNDAFLGATKIFSVPLMLFTFVTTVLAFYLAFGKYGSIRLGEGKPEYSNFSYITMMALAALASAAVYWPPTTRRRASIWSHIRWRHWKRPWDIPFFTGGLPHRGHTCWQALR